MTSRRPSAPRVRSGVDEAHASPPASPESPRDTPTGATAPARAATRAAKKPARDSSARASRETGGPAPSGRTRAPAGTRRRARLTSRPSARRGSGWSQARPEKRARPTNPDRAGSDTPAAERSPGPAVTLRTLALSLVLLVAFIVLAPTLRAYVTQREQFRQVNAELASVGADVSFLDGELGRWRDTGFVQAQARERLGFVRPGEVPYRVIDPQTVEGEDGDVAALQGLTVAVDTAPVVPWYLTMWESVVDAGEPLDKVDAIDILTGAPATDSTSDGAADQ